MLNDILTPLKSQFTYQTELRAQQNLNCQVLVKDGKLVRNLYTDRSGVFARVFKGGLFGSASSSEYDEAHCRDILEHATRLAEEADARVHIGEDGIPPIENGKLELDRELRELDQKMHMDFAFEIDNYIAAKYPDLTGREIRVRSQVTEKRLVVTNGWDAHTAIIRAYVDIDLKTVTKDGEPISLGNYYGHNKYLDEVFFSNREWLYEKIDELYHQLMDFREGVYPEAGVHDIILSPDLTGMLSHEAMGHTVEADGVLGGSISGLYMGRQIASEIVTLMDYANTVPDGEAYCRMLVDDEGTPCEDVPIITNGILTGYMHSRQTARNFGRGGKARGNCRASQYYDEPMIRMRNTGIAPGKNTLDEMIASVDHGYYLVGNENGSGATNGEYIIVSSLGYEIKNGKILRPIRGTTMSGLAFEMLKSVSMIGNKQEWRFGGMCGKKQGIETATGGPAIKCRANLAGR